MNTRDKDGRWLCSTDGCKKLATSQRAETCTDPDCPEVERHGAGHTHPVFSCGPHTPEP